MEDFRFQHDGVQDTLPPNVAPGHTAQLKLWVLGGMARQGGKSLRTPTAFCPEAGQKPSRERGPPCPWRKGTY